MGFLESIFGDPAAIAKRHSIRRWAQDIELPHPDELEEFPFTDPNFYSENEDQDEDDAKYSEKDEIAPRRENNEDHLPTEDSNLQPAIAPKVPFQITTTVPFTQMSPDKKFDYSEEYTVSYSAWDNPFQSTETQENYSYTPYTLGAVADDGGYKRVVQPVRHKNVYQIDGTDEDEDDHEEGESQSDDESSSNWFSYYDNVESLTCTTDSRSAGATSSSNGAFDPSTAVNIRELVVNKKSALTKIGTHAPSARLSVTIKRTRFHELAFIRCSSARRSCRFSWRTICFIPIAIDTFQEVKRQEEG